MEAPGRTLHEEEWLLIDLMNKLGELNKKVGKNPYDGPLFQELLAVREHMTQAIEDHFAKHWWRGWYRVDECRLVNSLRDYEITMHDYGRLLGTFPPATPNLAEAQYSAHQLACLDYNDCAETIERHFKRHYWHRFLSFLGLV